jgi:hypothetical protein
MEKEPKDQADGKCSRTGPFAPTVGVAYARSVRAIPMPFNDSFHSLIEKV